MLNYFKKIFNALTETLGALSGLTINSNETTSGAAYRLRNDGLGWLYIGINKLFFWQDDHCYNAVVKEIDKCRVLLEAYEYLVLDPHTVEEVVAVVDEAEEAPFDAQAYLDSLTDQQKTDVVQFGVNAKMTVEQRREVIRLAKAWFFKDTTQDNSGERKLSLGD